MTSPQRFSGQGTYYDITAGLTSCGGTYTNDDMVCALSHLTMHLTDGANPTRNPQCGRRIRVYSDQNTEGVILTIVDDCGGCPGTYDIDMTPTAFSHFADQSVGRIDITWEYVDG